VANFCVAFAFCAAFAFCVAFAFCEAFASGSAASASPSEKRFASACAAFACCEANVHVHPFADALDVAPDVVNLGFEAPDVVNLGFEDSAPLAYAVQHSVKLVQGGQRDVVVIGVNAPQGQGRPLGILVPVCEVFAIFLRRVGRDSDK
jgi:hypothetical protein